MSIPDNIAPGVDESALTGCDTIRCGRCDGIMASGYPYLITALSKTVCYSCVEHMDPWELLELAGGDVHEA